jgi:hypothetical protein
MPVLLDRSPIPKLPSEVVVRGERVRTRAHQIILWVSLTHIREKALPPTAVPFPAILDTGHTHTFSIQERHLTTWAGLRPDTLGLEGTVRDRGQRLSLRTAKIWVHPTVRGSRDELANAPPYPLPASRGIAVYPSDANFPRLPILGLRAITDNELALTVDGRRRAATLRTARRWWPFP